MARNSNVSATLPSIGSPVSGSIGLVVPSAPRVTSVPSRISIGAGGAGRPDDAVRQVVVEAERRILLRQGASRAARAAGNVTSMLAQERIVAEDRVDEGRRRPVVEDAVAAAHDRPPVSVGVHANPRRGATLFQSWPFSVWLLSHAFGRPRSPRRWRRSPVFVHVASAR